MIAAWSPTKERNIIASIVYAGTALGTAIYIICTGVIADKMGWQAIFYVEGSICLIWCAAWIFIADSPQEQKLFITKEEKKYILNSIGKSEHQDEVYNDLLLFSKDNFVNIYIFFYLRIWNFLGKKQLIQSHFGQFLLLIFVVIVDFICC